MLINLFAIFNRITPDFGKKEKKHHLIQGVQVKFDLNKLCGPDLERSDTVVFLKAFGGLEK